VDLCVRADQYEAAQALLARAGGGLACAVDLHAGFSKLPDRSPAGLFERSLLLEPEGLAIRVLSPEDHLRHLCVHLLAHGAWRPLWLCDVAAAVEGRPADFDWARCLAGRERHADWVRSALLLAHRLLGARLDGVPIGDRAARQPAWLLRATLGEWGRARGTRPPLFPYVHGARGLVRALADSWPNPILATVERGGPLNRLPRLPFQLAQCLARAGALAGHAAGRARRGP
jgi:hypothetical protein